jgi:hypothetical protein
MRHVDLVESLFERFPKTRRLDGEAVSHIRFILPFSVLPTAAAKLMLTGKSQA